MARTSILKHIVQKSKKLGQSISSRRQRRNSMCSSANSRYTSDGVSDRSLLSETLAPQPQEDILLNRLGGMIVLGSIANEFCRRVTEDPILKTFFAGLDPRVLTAHQKTFFAMAFTGTKKDVNEIIAIRAAHQRLFAQGLDHTHFDIFATHLAETLTDRGFRASIVDEAKAALVPIREIFRDAAEDYRSGQFMASLDNTQAAQPLSSPVSVL
ncbi:whole genome shotgun sequence [Seminavis robusta]|uniref:Whole genome shotgun sequence n=1 Tax=Seminavis robusta TaxID=568900 RepID=A0A9N8D6K2_9STRA|nr:whole genome shotgun sequence [Seminavis robusta]|eukprot:Sro19_g013530.1 whole genome shotgun sequence (212) ;mRNA; f:104755-105390